MGLRLLEAAVKTIAKNLDSADELKAANNYIKRNPNTPVPKIPISRNTPAKPTKKDGLSDYSDTVAGVAGLVGGVVLADRNGLLDSAKTAASDAKQKLDQLKAGISENAKLLQNQLELKDSLNDISDAINGASIVAWSALGTLDSNLKIVGSALVAISNTLLDISTTYKSDITNTDDLPYIDSKTFYDLLQDSGMSFNEAFSLKNQEDVLVESLMSQGLSYPEIKQAVLAFRNVHVPANFLMGVEKGLSGISSPSPVDFSSGEPVKSPDFTSISEWAIQAKAKLDFELNPREVNDLDGNPLANLSPVELQTIKNASDARLRTDQNNLELDETDFPSFDYLPILPFVGRESIFNPNHETPTSNPFSPKSIF